MDRDQTGHTVSRRTVPESTDHTTAESTNKWSEIAGQLIDRLAGGVCMRCVKQPHDDDNL
jgi:hypothetical protein